MEGQQQQDDEALAKSEQLARDLQLAYELEYQQNFESNIESSLARGSNDVASNTNILGGGSLPTSSTASGNNRSSSPFSRMGNRFSRNRNNSLMDDGSANMQTNGSLLYVPCEINGRMVEMMVDSGSQTSVISSSMMAKLKLQKRLNTRFQGVAAGVGAAKILGRIDNCAVMVGAGVEFKLFFLVIDVSHDMMILGVDQVSEEVGILYADGSLNGTAHMEVPALSLPPDAPLQLLDRSAKQRIGFWGTRWSGSSLPATRSEPRKCKGTVYCFINVRVKTEIGKRGPHSSTMEADSSEIFANLPGPLWLIMKINYVLLLVLNTREKPQSHR